MEKFHQKTSSQLNSSQSNSIVSRDYELDGQVEPTLHRRTYKKSEIHITRRQLDELIRLFKDYNIEKPGWLRQRFKIDMRRRKKLNQILLESSCDSSACSTNLESGNWSCLLHEVWHQINEMPICE